MRMPKNSALALLAVFVAVMLSGCNNTGKLSLPEKPSKEVVLKAATAQEQFRTVHYKHGVKTDAQIEYVDGSTAFVTYRADATVAQVQVFYQAPKGSAVRPLKRLAIYLADGKTYLRYTDYFADGTVQKTGTLSSDGKSFETYTFTADVHQMTRHQHFIKDDTWKVETDLSLYPDGSIQSQAKLQADGSLVTTAYSPTGVRTMETNSDKWGSTITTTTYWPDGQQVAKVVQRNSYMVTVETHREDGTLAEKRLFYSSSMTVFIYGPGAVPQFKQEWTLDTPAPALPGVPAPDKTYHLKSLYELNAKEQTLREIDFADDGVTPKAVSIYDPDTSTWQVRTARTYAADGTLAKVEVKDASGTVVSTTDHTPGENIHEKFPHEWMIQRSYETPPEPTKVSPSYPYMGGEYDFD